MVLNPDVRVERRVSGYDEPETVENQHRGGLVCGDPRFKVD
jgi:hypothetical protein